MRFYYNGSLSSGTQFVCECVCVRAPMSECSTLIEIETYVNPWNVKRVDCHTNITHSPYKY